MSKQMEKATENSGFLDGRDYSAAFLYDFFSLLVGNGVYANELAPTATNENMSITHGVGHAWINGVCYKNTTPFVLDIATADGSLNRYDSLMLRLDHSINEAYATIVQGSFAADPTPPAVTRNADVFELKICDIYIPAGCTKITQAQITDTRLDSSVCGVPVFPVEHLDMTTFYQQIVADLSNFQQNEEAGFASWAETQEESHLATMADLVEVVRKKSENSTDEIAEVLKQLHDLIGSDTVGDLLEQINGKVSKKGGVLLGTLNTNGNRITGLPLPTNETDAVPYSLVKNLETEIWNNEQPTSAFSEQSVQFSVPGGYDDTVIVHFCVAVFDQVTIVSSEIPLASESARYRISDVANNGTLRNFQCYRINSQSIAVKFENASRNGNQDNTVMIPIKIIYKKKLNESDPSGSMIINSDGEGNVSITTSGTTEITSDGAGNVTIG